MSLNDIGTQLHQQAPAPSHSVDPTPDEHDDDFIPWVDDTPAGRYGPSGVNHATGEVWFDLGDWRGIPTPFRDHAERWHNAGFAVFPTVNSTTRTRPALVHGSRFDMAGLKAKPTSRETLRDWMAGSPHSHVSVLLGERSGNMFVIHINTPFAESLDAAESAIVCALGPTLARDFGGFEWDHRRQRYFGATRRSLVYRSQIPLAPRRIRVNGLAIRVETSGGYVVVGEVFDNGGMTVEWPLGEPARVEDLTVATEADLKAALEACAEIDIVHVVTRARAATEDQANEAAGDPVRDFFAEDGARARACGWNVIPQSRDGKRLPSRIDGKVLAWGPFQTRMSTDAEFAKWCRQAPTANAAISLGPTSGRAMLWDVDVTDPALSAAAVALIEEVCGPTDLVRVGRAPRAALFYRLIGSPPCAKRGFKFACVDDPNKPAGDAVEILFDRTLITGLGLHHSTAREFQWPRLSPLDVGPEAAREITLEQVEEVIRRFPEIRPIYKPARSAVSGVMLDGDIAAPDEFQSVRLASSDQWAEVNGRVNAGRAEWFRALTWELARENFATSWSEADIERLVQFVARQVLDKVELAGAKWGSEGSILSMTRSRMGALVRMMGDPDSPLKPRGRRLGRMPAITAPTVEGARWPMTVAPAPGDYASKNEADILADREKRRLLTQQERRPKLEEARTDNESAIRAHLRQIAILRSPEGLHHILKTLIARGGAGTGKTVTSLDELAIDCLATPTGWTTVKIDGETTRMREKHLVFVRDYDMAEEKVAALLKKFNAGGVTRIREVRTGALEAPADEPGVLQISIWHGIDKSGCPLQPQREMLGADGISAAGLCSRRVTKLIDGSMVTTTERCAFWAAGKCANKQQVVAFANCQIIFVVHAYMTTTAVPAFLTRAVLGQVVDEDPTMAFVPVGHLSFGNLQLMRESSPTKALKKAGYMDEADMSVLRREGIKLALASMHNGVYHLTERRGERDVVLDTYKSRLNVGQELVLMDEAADRALSVNANAKVVHGRDVLAAMRRSCAKDDLRGLEVAPIRGTGEAFVAAIAESTSRLIKKDKHLSAGVGAERMYWQVVEEQYETALLDRQHDNRARRLHELAQDEAVKILENPDAADEDVARAQATMALPEPGDDRFADGLDARFQRVLHEPRPNAQPTWHIRISKRLEPILANVPMLLLDASADTSRVKKAWGRDVVEFGHKNTVPHHLVTIIDASRSYSPSSLLARKDDSPELKAAKARTIDDIRELITVGAYIERDGRILVAAPRKVRRHINSKRWASPGNVSYGHFGALRGRDFAKNYRGVIIIGRSQMTMGSIDGSAAGWGHDDEIAYRPFDAYGNGLDEDGKTLWRPKSIRTIKMRDGNDLQVEVGTMPRGRGEDIELAWREEEVYQTICRLRTAWREGEAPWAIILGQIVPDGVTVDVSTTLRDLISVPEAKAAEAARLTGELVNPPGSDDVDSSLDGEALPDYQTRAMVERRAVEIREFDKKVSLRAAMALAWKELSPDAAEPRSGLFARADFADEIVSIADDEAALVAAGHDVAALEAKARAVVAEKTGVEDQPETNTDDTPVVWAAMAVGDYELEEIVPPPMCSGFESEDDFIPFEL